MCVYIYICIHIFVYVCIYIHTYIYIARGLVQGLTHLDLALSDDEQAVRGVAEAHQGLPGNEGQVLELHEQAVQEGLVHL